MGLLDQLELDIEDGLNELGKKLNAVFYPAIDAYWIKKDIFIKLDVAGFDDCNIKVDPPDENIVTVRGERDSVEDTETGINPIWLHRPVKFRTRLVLPIKLRGKKELKIVERTLTDGVLTLKLSKIKYDEEACICDPEPKTGSNNTEDETGSNNTEEKN